MTCSLPPNSGATRVISHGSPRTRREEKLLPPETLHAVTMLRRTLSTMHPVDAMEQLTAKLAKFKSNKEFIDLIASARVTD